MIVSSSSSSSSSSMIILSSSSSSIKISIWGFDYDFTKDSFPKTLACSEKTLPEG